MDLFAALSDGLRSALGTSAVLYALSGTGLNIMFGYTGLLNFGHVASLLMGAYGTALTVEYGGPLWLGILVGVLGAVALGLVYGLPSLRLRADYLAITTIAAAEIVRQLARSTTFEPFTGGVFGLRQFAGDFYALNPFADVSARSIGITAGPMNVTWDKNTFWAIVVGWLLVAVATLFVWLLVRSPWGRVMKAIREDEDAARALGKNVFGYKLQSLVVGGGIGALAGAFFAIQTQSVNPDSFLPLLTFLTYAVVILGGPGSVIGPVVGGVIFWFVFSFSESVLRQASGAGYIPVWLLDSQDVASVKWILLGIGLMLLMIYRPQGIFGSREESLIDAR